MTGNSFFISSINIFLEACWCSWNNPWGNHILSELWVANNCQKKLWYHKNLAVPQTEKVPNKILKPSICTIWRKIHEEFTTLWIFECKDVVVVNSPRILAHLITNESSSWISRTNCTNSSNENPVFIRFIDILDFASFLVCGVGNVP